MRCVVTDDRGFVGSHVIEALAKAGHNVANVDPRPSETEGTIDAYVSDVETMTVASERPLSPAEMI